MTAGDLTTTGSSQELVREFYIFLWLRLLTPLSHSLLTALADTHSHTRTRRAEERVSRPLPCPGEEGGPPRRGRRRRMGERQDEAQPVRADAVR